MLARSERGPRLDVYTDAITCAPGTLDADNYAFVTGDKAKFTITAATLNVDAVDKSKEYGESDPALTYTLSGFKNGENATSAGVTGEADCSVDPAAGPEVGEFTDAITCAPGTLDADNYTFTTGDKGKLTITAATLNVDAVDKSKEYGESDPALTYTLSGFKNGENATSAGVTGDADCSLDPSAGPEVGGLADAITCAPGTLDADNYAFVTGDKGKLTITAATLNVDAVDKSKEYGRVRSGVDVTR